MEAPMDIEDLGKLGKKMGICPYYAARAVLPASHVVLLPYSGILSQVEASLLLIASSLSAVSS